MPLKGHIHHSSSTDNYDNNDDDNSPGLWPMGVLDWGPYPFDQISPPLYPLPGGLPGPPEGWRNRPTKGGSETTNGEGPASTLLRGVCYPLSSLPAGGKKARGPPGEIAPFALKEKQI